MGETQQSDIDSANAEFWNNLCGTWIAKSLGVTDDSPESLRKFDDWYMGYYPYLTTHVPLHEFSGLTVVEVGLGYGTLSQKIAEAGADYLGMDIAAGPVGMVRHRLAQAGLSGGAVQRSFFDNQLADNSVDRVVAIGCFHHTGNVQACFNETRRMLKPGGEAHLMVYNRYSHRRLMQDRENFLAELLAEEFGELEVKTASKLDRFSSDSNLEGEAAPETVYLSTRQVERMMAAYTHVQITKENMDESDDPAFERRSVLSTWGRKAGLDLYIRARK